VGDAPVGAGDTFFSGNQGLAELIVPNGAWVRLGNDTQIQFIALDPDLTEADMASGVARFYNKSTGAVVKVTSPFGYVLAYSGAVFDFYVGENSVEVVAVKGTVSFVHAATQVKYAVAAGSGSILADARQVSSGEGTVDPNWDRWNKAQDDYWAAKAREGGRSAQYLPPSLQDEAYALEENGTWEQVPYEGRVCWFWRPTTVALGWSPFTVGRWTDWHGDQTWIPAEPFGYVTHHYGNWVFIRNAWFWAPPVVRARVGLPLLDLGFFWWPGRVFWIHTGTYVGWVPLAPQETYYCHRRWGGPHTVVVNRVNITHITINIQEHAYAGHAVVVNRDKFFSVNDYGKVRLTQLNRAAIVNSFRAAPVVNNSVIDRWATNKERFSYTNRVVTEKPHRAAIDRIRPGEDITRAGGRERASTIQERVKNMPAGRIEGRTRIEAPRSKNYIVPLGQANRPSSEMQFQQKEIKTLQRPGRPEQPGRVVEPERVRPTRPGQQEQPAPVGKPEVVRPARPLPQEQPAQVGRPEVVRPTRPGQQEQPAQVGKPEVVRPARPAPQEQPAPVGKPEVVRPARPTPQEQPAQVGKPEVVRPTRPASQEQPARVGKPEVVRPARPTPQEQPAQVGRPEVVRPARPTPQEQPAPVGKPEVVRPARPGQQEQPAQVGKPEVVRPTRPLPQEQPAQVGKPEVVRPARPLPQEQPAQVGRPEVVRPARPTQPEQPAQVGKPQGVSPAKPSQPEKGTVEKTKEQGDSGTDQDNKSKKNPRE